jgi:membrane protease YdiL (CAAX protease family)
MKVPRTVPLGLVISAPIFSLTLLPKYWSSFPGQTLFAKAVISYALIAVLSTGAMAAFGEGRWKDFGFQRAEGRWRRFALYALALGAISTLAVKLGPGKGLEEAMKQLAPWQIPLLMLVASVVEELAARGWLQGFLEPTRARVVRLGRASVSVPVLTGALAFGAWHSPAIAIDVWTGAIMVAFTTLLGWLAGTSRERTGSLVPAIVTHLAGTVGGVAGGIVYTIAEHVRG